MDLLLRMSSTPLPQQQQPEENLFFSPQKCIWVNGPIIVGAGPSGLSVAACLRNQGVPFTIIERSSCIASLWQNRTYDRLKLHLPKKFCQLPNVPFPEYYPEYPTRTQFIKYLESYAKKFDIIPQFNESVVSAEYDTILGLWRVRTTTTTANREIEYVCRWIVVATGENSEAVVPEIEGLDSFNGKVVHVCDYKSGEDYTGKNVVVVGCGNSGMEVSLDLANHNANPSMVCRSDVHILPREVCGKSTFEIAVTLMKWLPIYFVDRILLILTWLIIGDVTKYGVKRPVLGPMELKMKKGKTPVLDIGAVEKIKDGRIKIVQSIKRFYGKSVEFIDGKSMEVDAVVLATGYKSNVPKWLKEGDEERLFDVVSGFPIRNGERIGKGKSGLYAVGFSRRGLSGLAADAVVISDDIGKLWKDETVAAAMTTMTTTKTKTTTVLRRGSSGCLNRRHRRCISTF